MSIANDNYGKAAFSEEELAAEAAADQKRKDEFAAKLENGFFQDGITRKVVFDNIEKEQLTSKAGNPYVRHTYCIRDVETDQRELHVDRNFQMTNAFQDIKREMGSKFLYGVTVMELIVKKTGEREFNGFTYPEWGFEFQLVGNEGKPPAKDDVQTGDIDVSEIPF